MFVSMKCVKSAVGIVSAKRTRAGEWLNTQILRLNTLCRWKADQNAASESANL